MSKRIAEFLLDNFGEEARVVYTFPVLFPMWEMDGEGYIVSTPQGKRLLVTNHGSPQIADESFLTERLDYYNEVVTATKAASAKLKNF
jgi:hypothetical protein